MAAVEYLYKAEHMMTDFDFQYLSSMPFTATTPSVDTLLLNKGLTGDMTDSLRSAGRLRPILAPMASSDPTHSSSEMALSSSCSVGQPAPVPSAAPVSGSTMSTNDRSVLTDPTFTVCLSPDLVSQLLIKRTLDASLLYDDSCTYDYISYLDKISCPWFVGIIQDWTLFCTEWRCTKTRDALLDHGHDTAATLVPAVTTNLDKDLPIARQEHCFNRLIRKMASRCRSIDEFRSAHMVQTDTLIYALRRFHNLTWLDLKDSQDLRDAIFEALAETTHSLSFIRLPGSKMKNVSTLAVRKMLLAQNKNTLCQFKMIHGSNIFEDSLILKALGEHHGHSMKRLTLAICDLEQSGLQEYGPMLTQLVSLNLENSSGVTNEVIVPILDTCRHLAKLDLTETDCTQVAVRALSTASDATHPQPGRFGSLRRLVLNNINSPYTTTHFFPLAEACPLLEELHMNSILADSFQDFSAFIAHMKHLRDLDIGNVFVEFGDANLVSLVESLPQLRWLSIANTQITDASLVYLAENATHLCDLCILGCDQVTKDGVLSFLSKLVNKSAFRRLDMTYCQLDEAAVEEIREQAKRMSLERGLAEMIEVEGDEQFADRLLEEEEDGEEGGREDDGEHGEEGEDEEIATLADGVASILEMDENDEDGESIDEALEPSLDNEVAESPSTSEGTEEEEEEDLSNFSNAS
ncbi:hypothetical protein BGZ94_003302 [Podila epigama]|nr:hypothetical protein BGZ94_003302 [Podila epigama]